MIRVEYFCTSCNGSAQRRDPGDEVSSGYHAETYSKPEEAKRGALSTPTGWTTDATGYLVCDVCVHRDTAIAHGRDPEPSRVPARDARVTPPDTPVTGGWPARETPFGG